VATCPPQSSLSRGVAFTLQSHDKRHQRFASFWFKRAFDVSYHLAGQARRLRECYHRAEGLAGAYYQGEKFVAALHRLRGEAGLRMARKVQPFFWSDAPLLDVWLCAECAREAGLAARARELGAA